MFSTIFYCPRILILPTYFIFPKHTDIPTQFYISCAYWYFLQYFIIQTSTYVFYHILHYRRILILPTYFIFPKHTDTSYHILYIRRIPILPTTFDISDAW